MLPPVTFFYMSHPGSRWENDLDQTSIYGSLIQIIINFFRVGPGFGRLAAREARVGKKDLDQTSIYGNDLDERSRDQKVNALSGWGKFCPSAVDFCPSAGVYKKYRAGIF